MRPSARASRRRFSRRFSRCWLPLSGRSSLDAQAQAFSLVRQRLQRGADLADALTLDPDEADIWCDGFAQPLAASRQLAVELVPQSRGQLLA